MTIMKSTSLALLLILLNIFSSQAQVPFNPEDISPLLIGETIPDANLIDDSGETINLNDQIKKMNTVLVFYRGGWCPYCNRQLSALADVETDIIELGYQIIAVSPDDYQNLKPTIQKDRVEYKVYSDPKGDFMQQVGISFTPSPKTMAYISKKTIGKTTEVLPVPTVLILNTAGEILFEYISPNYRQRLSPELLLAVLKNLN